MYPSKSENFIPKTEKEINMALQKKDKAKIKDLLERKINSLKNAPEPEDVSTKSSEKQEEEITIRLSYYSQWSIGDGGRYIPCFNTVNKVPAGLYEIQYSNNVGYFLQQQDYLSDDLLELPILEIKEILEDISNFWNREDVFKKYGYTHKRGILLYGPPGNGKSYLIQRLIKDLIENHDGVVFNLRDSDAIDCYINAITPVFRTIEPNRPIIVILEDIDNILEYGKSMTTKLLNILDGLKQINKAVYIGTTNYLDRIEERIRNRPSRFDCRYHIKSPSKTVREFYIKNKIKEDDLAKVDLQQWVKETKGMSLSHIKELIVSTIILGNSFEKSLERLKKLQEKPSQFDEKNQVGFLKTYDGEDE